MRTALLGLDLAQATRLLQEQGITPQVTVTAAPRGADREGTLRVVFASDDGAALIAARFVDPIAQEKE